MGLGKGGGSTYTPPPLPPLPTYEPPPPLPEMPKDPAAEYNQQEYDKRMEELQGDIEDANKMAKKQSIAPTLFTRTEKKSIQNAGSGPFS